MSGHSVGPWEYMDGDDRILQVGPPRLCVAFVPGGLDDGIELGPTSVANARLIAAAPDMFEALELIASRAGGCQLESHDPQSDEPIPEFVAVNEIREWARAAIARAEGLAKVDALATKART